MNIINGSKQFYQVVNDSSREVHILVNHKQPPYCAYKLTVPLVEHQIKTHSHSLSYYSKENVFFFKYKALKHNKHPISVLFLYFFLNPI